MKKGENTIHLSDKGLACPMIKKKNSDNSIIRQTTQFLNMGKRLYMTRQ